MPAKSEKSRLTIFYPMSPSAGFTPLKNLYPSSFPEELKTVKAVGWDIKVFPVSVDLDDIDSEDLSGQISTLLEELKKQRTTLEMHREVADRYREFATGKLDPAPLYRDLAQHYTNFAKYLEEKNKYCQSLVDYYEANFPSDMPHSERLEGLRKSHQDILSGKVEDPGEAHRIKAEYYWNQSLHTEPFDLPVFNSSEASKNTGDPKSASEYAEYYRMLSDGETPQAAPENANIAEHFAELAEYAQDFSGQVEQLNTELSYLERAHARIRDNPVLATNLLQARQFSQLSAFRLREGTGVNPPRPKEDSLVNKQRSEEKLSTLIFKAFSNYVHAGHQVNSTTFKVNLRLLGEVLRGGAHHIEDTLRGGAGDLPHGRGAGSTWKKLWGAIKPLTNVIAAETEALRTAAEAEAPRSSYGEIHKAYLTYMPTQGGAEDQLKVMKSLAKAAVELASRLDGTLPTPPIVLAKRTQSPSSPRRPSGPVPRVTGRDVRR